MNCNTTGTRLVRYEILMRKASDKTFEISEDYFCRGCKHHRPDWDYRFCVFTECPKMKGMKTFWEEVYHSGSE